MERDIDKAIGEEVSAAIVNCDITTLPEYNDIETAITNL